METTIVSTVPEALLKLVLNAMANLIVTKARKQQKDYHPMMVSRFDIDTWLREQGHQVPRIDVERALEVLTMKDSYARYYDSEYQGRKYRYYGLTKKFWAHVETKSQQTAGATA